MLICATGAFSQQVYTVEGQLLDRENMQPVPLAAVYINGTSIGTVTDARGHFRLGTVFLPCELILSHVSYNVSSIALRDSSQLQDLRLFMERRIIELREATVYTHHLRDEYLTRFKLWFLGREYEQYGAEIVNDSMLLIEIGENEQFSVEAPEPLEIFLPVTGYMLKVDLVNFDLTYSEEIEGYHCSILGYYFFEPRDPASGREQRKLARARTEAYYNSSMHFCKSLYHNQLLENGYLLETTCHPAVEEDADRRSAPDFIADYGQDEYGNNRLLLTRFSCYDFQITYHFNSRNRPVDLTYLQSNPMRVEQSGLRFLRDSVYIYPSGRIPENTVAFSGSIAEKGVISMVPEDYIPSMQ